MLLITPKYVSKTWGGETWIVNKEYCAKYLNINEGKYSSWHYHKIKDETFHVLKGRVQLLFGLDDNIASATSIILVPGSTFHIPVGMRHRFIGRETSVILEVSTHHEDSDSHRLLPACE